MRVVKVPSSYFFFMSKAKRTTALLVLALVYLAQSAWAAQDAVSLRNNTILTGSVVALDSANGIITFDVDLPQKGVERKLLAVRDVLMVRIYGKVYPYHQLPWSYIRDAQVQPWVSGSDSSNDFLWRYIAVLDFQGQDVPQEDLSALSERIRDDLKERNAFYVMNRGEMNALLRKSDLYGLECSDTACGRAIARVLRVPYVILGQIEGKERLYTFKLLLLNTRTGSISNSFFLDCLPCNQEDVIRSTVRALARDVADAATETLIEDETPAAPVPAATLRSPPPEKHRNRLLTATLVVLCLGLFFGASALLFMQ